MTYSFKETTYAALTALINEALEPQSFLPLKADKEPFLQIMPQLFAGHPDYHLFALLADPAQPAGFVALLPHEGTKCLTIGPLYISSPYRGQGLGQRLVKEIMCWAKAHGVKSLSAQTWGSNVPSRRIFEGLGFSTITEKSDTRVNGDSTVQYLKEIE